MKADDGVEQAHRADAARYARPNAYERRSCAPRSPEPEELRATSTRLAAFGVLLIVLLASISALVGCSPLQAGGYSDPTSSQAVQVLEAVSDAAHYQLVADFGRSFSDTEVASMRRRLLGSRSDASFGRVGFEREQLDSRPDGSRVATVQTGLSDPGVILPPGVVSESVSVVFVNRRGRWFVASIDATPAPPN